MKGERTSVEKPMGEAGVTPGMCDWCAENRGVCGGLIVS